MRQPSTSNASRTLRQIGSSATACTCPRYSGAAGTGAPHRRALGSAPSNWRAGQTYRAIDSDGLTAGGFSSSEGAAGFLLGRWLHPARVYPVGDIARFGEAWGQRVNSTLLAHTPTGTGATVELPGMRIHITVDVSGSVIIELDSQDTATDPSLATVDDLTPWAAAVLVRDAKLVHVDVPTPRGDASRDPAADAPDATGELVPDVFTQIAAEFDEDCTDLIVAEHRAANDSGARHSLEEVLGRYDLTYEDLQSAGDEPEDDGGQADDQDRPGSLR